MNKRIALFVIGLGGLSAAGAGHVVGAESHPLRVTEITQVTALENTYPSWSPDGTQIVFESTRDGDPEIFLMNADGSDVLQLTFNDSVDGSPVFSPDGSRIAFVSERDGNLEIYIMDVDGGNARNITNHPGADGHQKFSADGRYLVFRRVVEGRGRFADPANSEVFLKDLETGEEINLSRHPDFDGWPAWSPDGLRIAFASNRGGAIRDSWDVYVMDRDGANVIRLTFGEGEDGFFTKPDFSPDGRRLLVTRTLGDSVETFILELTDEWLAIEEGG